MGQLYLSCEKAESQGARGHLLLPLLPLPCPSPATSLPVVPRPHLFHLLHHSCAALLPQPQLPPVLPPAPGLEHITGFLQHICTNPHAAPL